MSSSICVSQSSNRLLKGLFVPTKVAAYRFLWKSRRKSVLWETLLETVSREGTHRFTLRAKIGPSSSDYYLLYCCCHLLFGIAVTRMRFSYSYLYNKRALWVTGISETNRFFSRPYLIKIAIFEALQYSIILHFRITVYTRLFIFGFFWNIFIK